MVEIEIISRDTIKPSSPTPHHLQKYQFSFLDQIAPPVFMPLVMFFPSDESYNNLQRSTRLKESLSDALTRFYPMAGRVVDNLYINCNDAGVPYVEAKVNCRLSDVIRDPVPSQLNGFLPYELDDVNDLSLVVQVNFFTCGGMAVGLGLSHKIADALSCFMFLTSWAALARRDHSDIPNPRFESAELFPPKDTTGFKASTGIVKEKISTKRFIFTASKITALRDKYAHYTECEKRPTRIEALSAFIWNRFISATKAKINDDNKIHTVLHAVNLRTRVDPPLPENYFGNISRLAIAVPYMGTDEDCYGVVNKMRDAIRNVNGAYVAKLREGDNHLNLMKERAKQVTKGEVVSFSFTSLCRFPLYEADFGWGKPVWVGSASLKFKNLIVFLDTRNGDGIEVWANLKREDMEKFEVDEELLEFVSTSF